MSNPLASPHTYNPGISGISPQYNPNPDGITVPNLIDPMAARAQMRPLSYQSAYQQGAGNIWTPTGEPSSTPDNNSALMSQFDNVGKSSLVIAPNYTPAANVLTPQDQRYTPPPTPQPGQPGAPGGLEGLFKGIVEQVGGFLPGDIRQHIENGLGIVANILDIPFEIVGNLPALPIPGNLAPGYSTDKAGIFAKLPETPEKGKVEALVAKDPANALWYISQYFKFNEQEIAHGMGVSPLVSDYFMPVDNLGDQIMKTLGVFGLPARLVERTYAGSSMRNLDSSVINADPSTLNPAVAALRQQYLDGTMSKADLLDNMARNGFGFSNNVWDNMLLSMVTDPMNLAMGAGVAEHLVESGATLARVGRTVQLATDGATALSDTEQAAMHAYAVQKVVDNFTEKGLTITTDEAKTLARDYERVNWLRQNGHEDLYQQAYDSMSGRDKALITLDPVLKAAAGVAKVINAPFDMFGHAAGAIGTGGLRNGDRIAAFSSRASVEGAVYAYDPERVLRLQKLANDLTGSDAAITDALGRMGANAEVGVQKDAITRMAMENGAVPPYMPDQIIRAGSEVYHSRLAQQTEGWVRRIKTQYLPTSRMGKEGIDEVMARQRIVAGQQLHDLLGAGVDMEKVRAFVEKADPDTLALIEHLAYTGEPVLKSFLRQRTLARSSIGQAAQDARDKLATLKGTRTTARAERAVKRAEGRVQMAERMTVIGPRELTDDRAVSVLNAVRQKDIVAVRDAVEKYDILYNNFAAKGLSDDELLRDMGAFIQDLRKGGKNGTSLVRRLKRDEVPFSEMRQWLDGQRDFARRAGQKMDDAYQIGLAPTKENRWRAVYANDGRLLGVNAWADAVEETAGVPSLSRLSIARQRLLRPIRGERILEETRRNFRERAVRDYELSRSEANALFSAIRRRAEEAGTMPRGLTNGELTDLAGKMNLTPQTMQRLGDRGLARMVAAAFEGDTLTVGLTQKASGLLKSATARKGGQNWLGVVAERIYPLARFAYNPIFLAQEAVEPFFWNLIKGIKPGMRWSQEDLRSMEALRRSGFLGEWADQWEYSPSALMLFASQETRRIFGPQTAVGKVWGTVIGEGRRVQSLAELKRLNYVRNVNRNFARQFKAAMNDMNPAFWDTLVREAGTADAGRVANHYWLQKAMYSPDSPTVQTFLMDATRPTSMGATSRIMSVELARLHHYTDISGLRRAITDKEYTESAFRDTMKVLGADPAYVDRAWDVATWMGREKWWDGWINAKAEQLGGTTEAIRAARIEVGATRRIWQSTIKSMGYDEDEFLATYASNPVKFLNSTRTLPVGAKFQMATPEELRFFYGRNLLRNSDPVVQRVTREARALSGTPPEAQDIQLPLAELNLKDNPDVAASWDYPYDEWMQKAQDSGLGQDDLERIALAHRQVPSMFHMLADMLPDETRWNLVRDHIAQPFDYHFHRLRADKQEADNFLLYTGNMLGADESNIGAVLDFRHPSTGYDYFSKTQDNALREGATIPAKGEPNTGIHTTSFIDPNQHYFGWYNEKGDLVATADVTSGHMPMGKIRVPDAPGMPIHRAGEDVGADVAGLPFVQQAKVDAVGVKASERGKGFYTKLADYVQSEGTFNWADITGRGSYTQQGSPAALAWLTKKDRESAAAANEAIASRMLAGYAELVRQRRMTSSEAIHTLQAAIESLSGRQASALEPGNTLAHDLMDMSRYPVDPWAEKTANEAGLMRAYEPTWMQRETMAALTHGDSVVPLSHDPLEHVAMRNNFRKLAAQANADEWLGRTDWAASDMQAIESVFNNGTPDVSSIDPVEALTQRTMLINTELEPHPGTSMYNSFPNAQDARKAGQTAQYNEGMEQVSADALRYWAPRLGEITGVSVVHASVGPVNHRVADYRNVQIPQHIAEQEAALGMDKAEVQALKDEGQWEGFVRDYMEGGDSIEVSNEWNAYGHGISVAVTGSDDAIEAAVAATGAEFQRREVWATSVDAIPAPPPITAGAVLGAGPNLEDTILGTPAFNDEQKAAGLKLVGDLNATWLTNPDKPTLARMGSLEPYRPLTTPQIEDLLNEWDVRRYMTAHPSEEMPRRSMDKPGWSDIAVTDFIIARDTAMSEAQLAAEVDDLMMNHWANKDADPGRMTVSFPDGRRAIRVLHEGATPEDMARHVRSGAFDLADVEGAYPISEEVASRLANYGVTIERKAVRSYVKRVDFTDAQQRAAELGGFLDRHGSFVEPRTGRLVRKDSTHDFDWEARRNWRTGEWTDAWLQHLDATHPEVADALRNRYRGEAIAHLNQSYWKHLPGLTAESRARDLTLPPSLRGWHYQSGPRGIRGATYHDTAQNGSMFLLKHAGPDTGLHETLHMFAPHFEDSMTVALAKAYGDATGKRVRLAQTAAGRPRLSRAAEEWASEEFVKYATTGIVRSPQLQSAFNTMGKLLKDDKGLAKLPEAHAGAADAFRQLLGQPNAALSAVPFNPDEYRILAAARYMLGASEDAAHKTHYFARGRSFLERSINHPYLGYYPASYMWGKVVPELVNFLVREPFGIRAPMWGYVMAGHVSQAILTQLVTDPNFKQWVTDHPQLIRFISMMLPGTPWDIPVNAPAWLRHTSREELRNTIRDQQGVPEKHADVLGELASSANYALGVARFATTISQIGKEIGGPADPQALADSKDLAGLRDMAIANHVNPTGTKLEIATRIFTAIGKGGQTAQQQVSQTPASGLSMAAQIAVMQGRATPMQQDVNNAASILSGAPDNSSADAHF